MTDPDNGEYWDDESETCTQCQKWSYTKKSCQVKDQATAAYDRHQDGDMAYDKKCMRKDVSPGMIKNELVSEGSEGPFPNISVVV